MTSIYGDTKLYKPPAIVSARLADPVIPDTGWQDFSSITNTDPGNGGVAWSNPSNAESNDLSFATTVNLVDGDLTQALHCVGANLNVDTGAIILGVEVRMKAHDSVGTDLGAWSKSAKLLLAGVPGTYEGTTNDVNGSIVQWPVGDTGDYIDLKSLTDMKTYGNPRFIWEPTLTPAQVNNADFGFQLIAQNPFTGTGKPNVDNIQIKVYFKL